VNVDWFCISDVFLPVPPKLLLCPDVTVSQNESNVEVNVSINEQNLSEVVYNWNGTNYTYYNNNFVLMLNFDKVSALGEHNTHIFDVSGTGNNGSVIGATWSSSGKYGGRFDFDGVNDYINVGSDASLAITGDLTLSAWVKIDSSPGNYGRIIFKSNSGFTVSQGSYFLGFDSSGTRPRFSVYGSSSGFDITSSSAISADEWHLLTGTYDNSGLGVLYIDGVAAVSSTALSGSIRQNLDQPVTIGMGYYDSPGGSYQFEGSIDEVRILSSTLSADEVYQQYISNLNKLNSTQWYLYVNQSKNATAGLDDGTYSYQVFAEDQIGNQNNTENRSIIINTGPLIFIPPTPYNFKSQTETNVSINVSITEENLDEVRFKWAGTNYTMYGDHLVLMMNFDNISALGESNTKVVDLSGNKNNGTVYNSVPTISGKYNGAYNFDGTGDYISATDTSLDLSSNFTVECWFKPSVIDTTYGLLSKDAKPSTSHAYTLEFGLEVRYEGGINFIRFIIGSTTTWWWYCVDSTTTVSLNNWYHVIAVFDGTTMKLCINGVEEAAEVKDISRYSDSGQPFRIGRHDDVNGLGGPTYFNGVIDELRIWDRGLSSDEVYQQYISNLNKFNQTQWYLYVNQSKNATAGLDSGTYTYQAFAKDINNNVNSTEERTIYISGASPPVPELSTIILMCMGLLMLIVYIGYSRKKSRS